MNSREAPVAPEFGLRRLEEDDWAALRAARLTALADAPYAFGSTLAREEAFGEDTWRSRTHSGAVFAAWSDEAIVGLATALLEPDEPGWELVGMWVSSQWRGTGLADRLVGSVCEHARGEGADWIGLWVTESNPRARAFYARLGFEPTGARQLVRPDEPDNWELEMTRRL
jgi:ribosomal protein S18 acetylase RimI-like enzyme